MPLSAKRTLASGINILAVILLCLPLFHSFDTNRHGTIITMFLVYNLVCELTMRRCLGSLVTGLQWHGSPPRWRRVAYCFTYTAAFVPYVIFPLWQAIPNLAAQWLWGKYVGGTIHSWLVGLESEGVIKT